MTYSDGETLVLTQLRAVTGFNDAAKINTSRANWKVLNSGFSDHYGIVIQGDAPVDAVGYATFHKKWQTIIQVWQRYKDDGTTQTSLQALIGPILTRFEQYRKLADTTGTVYDSAPTNVSKQQEMWKQGDTAPSWMKTDVTITWIEEEKVTYAE